jgi:hypothetical protein
MNARLVPQPPNWVTRLVSNAEKVHIQIRVAVLHVKTARQIKLLMMWDTLIALIVARDITRRGLAVLHV